MMKDGGVAARAFETAYAACARLSGLGWRAGGITTMLEPDEEFVGLEGTFGALFNPAIGTPPLTPEREAARNLLSAAEMWPIRKWERRLQRVLTGEEEAYALREARASGIV
jgi:hypothetical protein